MKRQQAAFFGAIALTLLLHGPATADSRGDATAASVAFEAHDYATAVRLWRSLADQGNAAAQSNLALMYSNGLGVSQDYGEAVKLYRRAAEQGYAEAERYLGLMYANGLGVSQDYAEAAKWSGKAADQGDATAQYSLGMMYFAGTGVPQDSSKAYMWLALAAALLPPGEDQDNAVRSLNLVASKMTTNQIAEAQKLAKEWKLKSE